MRFVTKCAFQTRRRGRTSPSRYCERASRRTPPRNRHCPRAGHDTAACLARHAGAPHSAAAVRAGPVHGGRRATSPGGDRKSAAYALSGGRRTRDDHHPPHGCRRRCPRGDGRRTHGGVGGADVLCLHGEHPGGRRGGPTVRPPGTWPALRVLPRDPGRRRSRHRRWVSQVLAHPRVRDMPAAMARDSVSSLQER
jgi:hypothetical protein